MRQSEIIKWYSRKDVNTEITRIAQNREIGVQFREGSYGKRPSIIQFPSDIIAQARRGAVSFHISEERWLDPMQLGPASTKSQQDKLRIGWDLIIDIDCPWFDYSTITAKVIIEALEFHGIKNPSIKFSGNKGWHIGIPFESFPSKVGKKETSTEFSEVIKNMLSYLKEFISERLLERIEESEGDLKKILKKTKKDRGTFVDKEGRINIFKLIDLDLALGSPRHLIRAPYSLHEKTDLVSLPIKAEDINKFKKYQAKPENIKEANDLFLNPKYIKPGEASQLFVQALDWQEINKKLDANKKVEIAVIEGKISRDKFPPCIKNILRGLEDGKKRSLFSLINFLQAVNWSWDEIENEIIDWNRRNIFPLKTGYLISQIRWHKRKVKRVPPPNCPNGSGNLYYKDTGTCQPDQTCKRIKNPLSYIKIKRVQ